MNARELAEVREQFPEGVPAWVRDKSKEEVVKFMLLRREAFPATARTGVFNGRS